MKNVLFIFSAFFCLVTVGCNTTEQPAASHAAHQSAPATATAPAPQLPAYFKDAASVPKPLPPTLSPDKFKGEQVKKAYRVAQEIPATLAQLPCFCYCDRAFGHKSLHSCYEDDHSASCSTCTDEALLAYKLQTEDKLSMPQIQEKIIAQFGH